jgi:hypothetical protein
MDSSRYRIGVELSRSSSGAALIEIFGSTCVVLEARRFSRPVGSSDELCEFPEDVALLRPSDCAWVAATIVVPPERTLEATFQVPQTAEIDRDDWERWEIPMRLIGTAEEYLFESHDSGMSPCGSFRNYDVLAVRKDYIDALMSSAARKGVCIDKICFPHRLWAQILSDRLTGVNPQRCGCLYVDGAGASMIRTTGSRVAQMSLAGSDGNGSGTVAESIDTLLSWHTRGQQALGMLMIDTANGGSSSAELMARHRLTAYDSRSLEKALQGSVDNPGRFLLPLAALGII